MLHHNIPLKNIIILYKAFLYNNYLYTHNYDINNKYILSILIQIFFIIDLLILILMDLKIYF